MKKFMKFVLALLLSVMSAVGTGFETVSAAERPEELNVAIIQIISHPSMDEIREGIYEELENQGYKEGDNLTVDFHNAEGDLNLLTTITDQVISNDQILFFQLANQLPNQSKMQPAKFQSSLLL